MTAAAQSAAGGGGWMQQQQQQQRKAPNCAHAEARIHTACAQTHARRSEQAASSTHSTAASGRGEEGRLCPRRARRAGHAARWQEECISRSRPQLQPARSTSVMCMRRAKREAHVLLRPSAPSCSLTSPASFAGCSATSSKLPPTAPLRPDAPLPAASWPEAKPPLRVVTVLLRSTVFPSPSAGSAGAVLGVSCPFPPSSACTQAAAPKKLQRDKSGLRLSVTSKTGVVQA